MSKITCLAIDLAKHVFQLHGVDDLGHCTFTRRVSRAQLLPAIAQLPPCLIAMEACGAAHHWARQFGALGHTVRLLAPQHVKPFQRGQKNDRNDAQAIACAARQPHLPQVAPKSEEQQAILALHRLRDSRVRERVARINQLHGLLGEFGLVLPRTPMRLMTAVRAHIEAGSIPALLAGSLQGQLFALKRLTLELEQLTAQLKHLARHSEPCQRLMRLRGVGPLIATAFLCEIGDASTFRNGRQVSAWLGLVPRQHSSGDRTRLLGITKRGNPYLRKLLVQGARCALTVAPRHNDPISRWVLALAQRRGSNRATVALANKFARHLWAALRYGPPAQLPGLSQAA